MKKLLLLIPVGLLAVTGIFWMNFEYSKEGVPSAVPLPQYPQELFSLSEHSLRQVIRFGDEKSLTEFNVLLDKLDSSLTKYKQLGLGVGEIREMIVQYKQDSANVTQAASPYFKKLDIYSDFEHDNEKRFILLLSQIGLYELVTTNANLDKARLEYIKEPSGQAEQNYLKVLSNMKQIITELYLDSTIEQPLFAYIDNHNHYFQTIVSIYGETGTERIYRLRDNGYAIKAQLQLLPKL
ncbi:MAG: hypothetical protein PHQ22_06540 [Sulfuricurvum sp.]|nr:hypothetical protein [Sulfuricurvum sp.]MDD5386835.1 hypothetical protein [Sulfuricurvum sp.]